MKIIAILLLLTVTVKADLMSTIGEGIGYTYTGICQGLQDDETVVDSVCVEACGVTYDYILAAFTTANYANGYSTTAFASYLQTANTYLQSSLNIC